MTMQFLDRPQVLEFLFHPRREDPAEWNSATESVSIPAAPGVHLGGRLYRAAREAPLLLYFHGNGEIAADYYDLAPVYNQIGITLLVVDYRGYGRSDGTPTATNLLADATAVYDALNDACRTNDLAPPALYVMGRSLGSASALEIAHSRSIAGLVIESGFANTLDLLVRLGFPIHGANEERDGFGNLDKISRVSTRTLIIHGEDDTLIPISDAEALYQHSGAVDKQLVRIPHAGHGDLMITGMQQYFGAIREFVNDKYNYQS